MPVAEDRRQQLLKALKRCHPAAVEAALRFEESRDFAEMPAIILGVIERDAAHPKPGAIAAATDASLLIEDLGMDSFGMIEVAMTAEEVLGITVPTHELHGIRTLGDLKEFLRVRLAP